MSRASYINRKKRIRETCWRQSEALKRVVREAKRELLALPEISHEAAEAILRSQAPRTDDENVFFCAQSVLSTLVDH